MQPIGEPVMFEGPNIVVKGPPYIPTVESTEHGSRSCFDYEKVNHECKAAKNCVGCTTFNQGDIDFIRRKGWNSIRLGVIWSGAQNSEEDFKLNRLTPDFEKRLHALLDLTDREGIHVILDNHGDMVGSAGCGNGAPMWFQKQ